MPCKKLASADSVLKLSPPGIGCLEGAKISKHLVKQGITFRHAKTLKMKQLWSHKMLKEQDATRAETPQALLPC